MPCERHKPEAEPAHVYQLLCPLRKVIIIIIDDDYDDDEHDDGFVHAHAQWALLIYTSATLSSLQGNDGDNNDDDDGCGDTQACKL